MNVVNFTNQVAKIKPGSYFRVGYITYGKKDLASYKIVECVCRFQHYKSANGNDTTPSIYTKVSEHLYQTSKGNLITQLFITDNPNHKPQVKYYNANGKEITKQEYESINGVSKPHTSNIFAKKIEDIIYIGK